MPSIDAIADKPVQTALRDAIRDADGHEVYFRGRFDASKKLVEVEVLARGTVSSVAAGMPIKPPWNAVLHNHPGGVLHPSEADVSISAWLSIKEVAFLIINNDATQYCAVTEPVIVHVPADIKAESVKKLGDHPLAREFLLDG
ncbi:MAG TPA: hypothetical protein PLD82_05490, partial [Spirochaetota bacterium]|nr:hypothetical protein [Spirochaetota bacterium]